MADAILKGGSPMAQVELGKRNGRNVSATWTGGTKIVSAVLNYTTALGVWQKREWKEIPAAIGDRKVTAELPEGTTVYYFNLTDDQSLVASSEHEEL